MLKSILKSVIGKYGLNFIEDPRFINVLNDYRAFAEEPATKFVLKIFIHEGFVRNIVFHISQRSYSHALARKILDDLYFVYGFRRDVSIIVVNAFLFALGQQELSFDCALHENKMATSSESQEKHIIFSGISLSHSIDDIAKHLLTRGFKKSKSMPYNISMKGTFCGINGVELYISGSPLGVTRSVSLDFGDYGGCIFIDYSSQLYSLLFNKYGKPDHIYDPLNTVHGDIEYYIKNTLAYSDMRDNYKEIIKYRWNVEGGEIELRWWGKSLSLTYKDTLNIELAARHQKQFNAESI